MCVYVYIVHVCCMLYTRGAVQTRHHLFETTPTHTPTTPHPPPPPHPHLSLPTSPLLTHKHSPTHSRTHANTRAHTHQPALALLLYAWSRYQPEFVDTYHVNVTVAALGAVLCSGDEELLAFGVPCQILRRRFVAGVPDQVLSCVLCVCLSLSLSLSVCVCVCVCMYMCIDMYVCI